MARLMGLGQPFGSPGRIINIPAPRGSEYAGQQQMQAMQGLGQALGAYLGQQRLQGLEREDLRRIESMPQTQDIFNTMFGARGMQAPQAQVPQMVSPQGRQAQFGSALSRTFGTQAPFTLTPGAQRFTGAGEPVAEVPVTTQRRAGDLQVAKAGDGTGLPEGTVYQAGPQGKITIISEPQTLTIDEQRKRDLIAGGLKPKEVSELEKELTRTVIAKNRAEAEAKLKAGKGILTPEQKISQANIFRKEFDGLSKDFRVIRDSFERVKASAVDPSPAGDLALIFNYMKILDPGSVVRESEFATAAATGAWGERLKAAGLMILEGVRLSPKMRADFLDRAGRLFKAQQGTQKTLINRYTKLSNRFGLNPQDVITETDVTIDRGLQTQQPITNEGISNAISESRKQLGVNATEQQILDLAQEIFLRK